MSFGLFKKVGVKNHYSSQNENINIVIILK